MGFLDKAKAAANDLAAKADSALNSAEGSLAGGASPKQADPLLRDLGVIAYLEATGRPMADADAQRARCIEGIQAIEGQTQLDLQMGSAPPPAPGATTGAAPSAPPGTPGRCRAAPTATSGCRGGCNGRAAAAPARLGGTATTADGDLRRRVTEATRRDLGM